MTVLVQGKPDIVAGLIKDLPNFEVQQETLLVNGEEFSIVVCLIPEDVDIDHIDDFEARCVGELRPLCLDRGHRVISPSDVSKLNNFKLG